MARRLNYRAGGICISHGRLLVHRAERDDFWALPGGRCELGETTAEALCREIQEELCVSAKAERLICIIENFFRYGGEDYQELGLYHQFRFGGDGDKFIKESEFEGVEASTKDGKPMKLHL